VLPETNSSSSQSGKGDDVGEKVGFDFVGATVGSKVIGEKVGLDDGVIDGEEVGFNGDMVGAAVVGVSVGALVHDCRYGSICCHGPPSRQQYP